MLFTRILAFADIRLVSIVVWKHNIPPCTRDTQVLYARTVLRGRLWLCAVQFRL